MATSDPPMDNIKEVIFNDALRRDISADMVPALLESLGIREVDAASVKQSEGGLVNTVLEAGKYIVKVNTFKRFPFRVYCTILYSHKLIGEFREIFIVLHQMRYG